MKEQENRSNWYLALLAQINLIFENPCKYIDHRVPPREDWFLNLPGQLTRDRLPRDPPLVHVLALQVRDDPREAERARLVHLLLAEGVDVRC